MREPDAPRATRAETESPREPEKAQARCSECGSELPSDPLSCPICHRLVHAGRLSELAASAESATRTGDLTAARDSWRHALELLPETSRQATTVRKRIESLTREIESSGSAGSVEEASAVEPAGPVEAEGRRGPARAGLRAAAAAIASGGLLVWKLKFVLTFVLTKGKLLLLGLTKGSTVFSMLLSLGVYWTAFGWWFAAGLIASIYIHEMGHVAALQRLGIRASAPMFLPGIGAVVRLKEYPAGPCEDARVGLAGPLYGLASVLAFYTIHLATGIPHLAAIARVAAWINLFNLLPVWQLDGSRGLRALSGAQRWMLVAALVLMWTLTQESLLLLLGAAATFRIVTSRAPDAGDTRSFATFLLLVVGLGALCTLDTPTLSSD